VTGSFRRGGWAVRAFTLLKAGCRWPKSAKQVEIRLAILPKILGIAAPGAKILSRGRKNVRLLRLAAISAQYG
jgi:hypothetical protein